MILGHNHPKVQKKVEEASKKGLSFGAPCEAEVILADKIKSFFPSIDLLRMVNSGTEASMSAVLWLVPKDSFGSWLYKER